MDSERCSGLASAHPTRDPSAYLNDFIDGQFRESMPLTAIARTMPNTVSLILGRRPPREVVEVIVRGITVNVTTFLTLRAWTDKSFEDQTMDVTSVIPAIAAQIDETMTPPFIHPDFHVTPRSDELSSASASPPHPA